jgi:uncharacterized protein YjbI with pentapeptide repeats
MDVSELLERYAEGERFFCDVSLRDANLSGVELWGAKLRNANLSGANLTNANLYSIYLIGADLTYADFRNANLRNAKLSGANLSAARLCGADLSKADLSPANLSYADLRDAKLLGADLNCANLHGALLTGASLNGSNLRQAQLVGAKLTNANLGDIHLWGANLCNANLIDAKLTNAKLANADLRNAKLNRADLSAADLSEANLKNAKLTAANLSFSDLTAADLTGVNLEGTILSKAEVLPTSKIDWTALLQAQQADFIQRLKLGYPLHCEAEGQHSELTIISGKSLAQLIDFCWEMAEKYKRNNPVRKVFINNMKGKLGEEVVKSRLAGFVTEVDYEKRISGDGKVDFRLTSNPAVGIQVKTSYSNINGVRWTISQEEVEKNTVLVCIFSQEEFDDRQAEYNLIMAGFLLTNMIQLESGKASVGISQLLYGGGLRSYLGFL